MSERRDAEDMKTAPDEWDQVYHKGDRWSETDEMMETTKLCQLTSQRRQRQTGDN